MSRSDYTDDEYDQWAMIRWRGAVASAIRGKRGQSFLRETLAALDAIEDKSLIAEALEDHGEYCTLGAVAAARGVNVTEHDFENDELAKQLGVAEALVREIEYENDEGGRFEETPEFRWKRMRCWILRNLEGGTA